MLLINISSIVGDTITWNPSTHWFKSNYDT